MHDSCNGEWQVYGCGWGLSRVWSQMNLVAHIDILLLATALLYVFAASANTFRRHRSLIKTVENASARRRRSLELTTHMASIRSVSTVAPYLGFVGAVNGILCAFTGGGMQTGAWVIWVTTKLAIALVPTAAAILVSISAIVLHNVLRATVEDLDSGMSHEKFPLLRRFSKLPPLATIGSPILIFTILAYMIFAGFHVPMGLEVRLLKLGPVDEAHKASILVEAINLGGKITIFVNGKLASTSELAALSTDTSRTVYVEAERNVPWFELVNVIDVAKSHSNDVVLLTSLPEHRSSRR